MIKNRRVGDCSCMGACRETCNIFYYLRLFFKERKSSYLKRVWYLTRHFNKLTYEDSFMPIVCRIKGHKPYQPDAKYEPESWACKRCHRYIPNFNPRKEKLKRLNIIK